jgi:hypothetical protein
MKFLHDGCNEIQILINFVSKGYPTIKVHFCDKINILFYFYIFSGKIMAWYGSEEEFIRDTYTKKCSHTHR